MSHAPLSARTLRFSRLQRIQAALPVLALAALAVSLPAQAAITGFDNGVSTTENGASTVAGGTATLTNNFSQTGSVFFNTQQQYGTFTADFDYTASNPLAGFADGFTFVLQNDPRGATAIGTGDHYLGYGGAGAITPSVSLQTNIYEFRTRGLAYNTNGGTYNNTPGYYTAPGAVDLVGGPVHYHVTYDGTTLTSLLTQGINSFSFSQAIDLDATLGGGGLAYVGFTGGTGGYGTTQQISNFNFLGAALNPPNGGGPAGAPLPVAVWAGLVLGAGVIARNTRRRQNRATPLVA